MKHRIALYLFLVATLCVGCGDAPSMRQLQGLEARVDDVPDSVLAVLTAADMPRWGEARALYALLTVQAQDKSYIDVTDDSLISVATRYYERRGPALHRLQAYYYHGLTYQRKGANHEAMLYYTQAKDLIDEVNSPYPVGLLCAQMGTLYADDYDYQHALIYMKEALQYYEKANKERLGIFAKLDIGLFYLNMYDFQQAETSLREVLSWGEIHNDAYVRFSSLNGLLRLYDATKDIESLNLLFESYPPENLWQNTTTLTTLAHYYAQKGDKISAEKALAQAREVSTSAEDTAKLWYKSYQINKALGETDDALSDYEHLLAHQDSVVRITLQQPLLASQLDHYQSRLEVEELRNLNYRYLMSIAALALMVVAAILYIYVSSRFRHKQEELNEYMELSEGLLQRISEHDSAAVQMQGQIAELFGGQFQLLNKLSETYYEHSASKAMKEQIFTKVKDEIERLQSGKELPKIEAIVNKHLDNVMVRLRSELPHLKEKDYAFLTYLYARFSGKAIGAFMKLERNHIYQIKHRLCSEIKDSDAPSKQLFLDMMP